MEGEDSQSFKIRPARVTVELTFAAIWECCDTSLMPMYHINFFSLSLIVCRILSIMNKFCSI